MDTLKKLFPHAFKAHETSSLIVSILVYIAIALVGGIAVGLITLITGWIPVLGTLLGIIFKILGTAVGIYTLAGIVMSVLVYNNMLR